MIKRLNDIHWNKLSSVQEIHEVIDRMKIVKRVSVRIHQNGTVTGGVEVLVSSMEGVSQIITISLMYMYMLYLYTCHCL